MQLLTVESPACAVSGCNAVGAHQVIVRLPDGRPYYYRMCRIHGCGRKTYPVEAHGGARVDAQIAHAHTKGASR